MLWFGKSHPLLLMVACFTLFVGVITTTGVCSVEKDYILGVGDILKIQVWENNDLTRTVEISQEGAITFPLIGRINVMGLSLFETEELLKKKLGDGYLVSPQLSISVQEYKSQKVLVFGEVKKPGILIIKGATPLLEVISMAGGFTEKASQTIKIVKPLNARNKNEINVHDGVQRQDSFKTIDLRAITAENNNEDHMVTWGDSIYVGEIEHMYITGEVKNPGRFEWHAGLTIHQAISLAGGATKRGAVGRTKVARMVEGKENISSADMNGPVKPGDIIKVPESYF